MPPNGWGCQAAISSNTASVTALICSDQTSDDVLISLMSLAMRAEKTAHGRKKLRPAYRCSGVGRQDPLRDEVMANETLNGEQ